LHLFVASRQRDFSHRTSCSKKFGAILLRKHLPKKTDSHSGGAVAGGVLIGVVQSLTALFLPEATQLIVFVLMGLVLLFRPRGLLGTLQV